MPIVKVIEVIASSEKSYVKDFKVHVKDEKVSSYGVICKVSFRVNDK